ncbi:DegT/DnrJ/EryC1/StrS family aminotransferase [Pseudonocardia halophobica]|uniref:DegT/DnrJ/EryC1/StrS family aminotransferase n=1 Tax=Pseudonocardia halophobica TaxID=29401 RepID=UPI003D8D9F54
MALAHAGSRPVPISTVRLDEAVEASVLEVLRSGHLAQGAKVAEFEQRFAELSGVEHAIAVSNGSTALTAALLGLGVGPGDEVVTSPFTFIATVNAVLATGAKVRFADISARDFALDPASAADQVGERATVLMPVHLFGQTADMDPLTELAREHGLHLVEDAAQAHGARYRTRAAGSFGVGCFSFYATKNLTTGEGGMITTSDDVLADRLRVLRNQGMRARYEYEMVGHNYRMTDLAAAVGLPQLAGYTQQVERRRRHAARLTERLSGLPGLRTPEVLPGRQHVWHQYTVLLEGEAAMDRDGLAAALAEQNIGSGIYYPHLASDYACYRDHPLVQVAETPVAREVAAHCLSLPVHAALDDDDVERVADAVSAALS